MRVYGVEVTAYLFTSGSTSPSQMIQQLTSLDSFTTLRAASVSTPSAHSRVSMSMCPSSRSRCIDLGVHHMRHHRLTTPNTIL